MERSFVGDVESLTTLARLRGKTNFSAMQFRELARDEKTEPRASVLDVGTWIRLLRNH